MPGLDEFLTEVARGGAVGTTPAAQDPQASGEEVSVAEFVARLNKTADSLDKAADTLPTSAELASQQLRMLGSPLGINRGVLHEQHKQQFGAILPAARGSLSIPASVGAIQKSAAAPRSVLARLR
jgi:hypothetical protein